MTAYAHRFVTGTGFSTVGRLAALDLFNEASAQFTSLRLAPSPSMGFRQLGCPSSRPCGYMCDEQFTW